jgi:uncharacterized protein
LVLGAGSLMKRSTTVMPIAASLLLIATGLYTATGRASADLTSIAAPNTSNVQDATSLISLQDETLPCCQGSE